MSGEGTATTPISQAEAERYRDAIDAVAAMRMNWKTFTSEWPYNVVDAFWECVAIAETALEQKADRV